MTSRRFRPVPRHLQSGRFRRVLFNAGLLVGTGMLTTSVHAIFTPVSVHAAQGDCAQPVSTGASPSVTDCLMILRSAVGGTPCDPLCMCAPKGSLPTSALDALICLKAAVGQPVTLACPCEPPSTTTTTSPSTTLTTLPDVYKEAFPNACLTIALRRAFAAPETMRSAGQVELLIDRTTLGDRDGDGLEDAGVTVYGFHFEADSDAYGDVTFELIDPSIHPAADQTTQGLIEEGENATPGDLDLPPFEPSSGGALMAVHFLLQALMEGPSAAGRAHNDYPLILGGVISNAVPPPGQILGMQNDVDIPLLSDGDGSFFNIWIESSVPATLELNAQSCE